MFSGINMRTCNGAFKVGYTEPSKFHTFTNICFRERRGESLWIDKPVSLTLKHTLCILTLQGSGQESLGEDSIFVSFLEAPMDSFYSASESEQSRDLLGVGLPISVVSVSLFARFWTLEDAFPFLFFLHILFPLFPTVFDGIFRNNELPMFVCDH